MPPLTLTVRKPCRLGARFLEPGDQILVEDDGASWVVTRAGTSEDVSELLAGGLLRVQQGDPSTLPTSQPQPRLRLC
jgi:hypothetical protein